MEQVEKKLSEITREEWIKFQWREVTSMGDDERTFLKDYQRTPDEARQAMEDWDSVEYGLNIVRQDEQQEHSSDQKSD